MIQYGFKAARFDWVFYTDGDGQYQLKDLIKLVVAQSKTQADLVNGYKVTRHDPPFRKLLGNVFKSLYGKVIHPPISDIHCDFRLVKRNYLTQITWRTSGSSIISELILKVRGQGAVFAEVSVSHLARAYGRSNYFWLKLSLESCQELFWSLKYSYLSDHSL